jgi:hypothetical protein
LFKSGTGFFKEALIRILIQKKLDTIIRDTASINLILLPCVLGTGKTAAGSERRICRVQELLQEHLRVLIVFVVFQSSHLGSFLRVHAGAVVCQQHIHLL